MDSYTHVLTDNTRKPGRAESAVREEARKFRIESIAEDQIREAMKYTTHRPEVYHALGAALNLLEREPRRPNRFFSAVWDWLLLIGGAALIVAAGWVLL